MGETEKTDSFYRDTIEEMESEEHSLEDPLTFWQEEKKTLWKKIFGRTETPFYIMGAGLILLVIVFFIIAPGGGNEDAGPALDQLSGRLEQLEKAVGDLEGRMEGLAQVESKLAVLEKSVLRSDSADASAVLRMNRITSDIDTLKRDVDIIKNQKAAAGESPTSSGKTEEAQPASQAVYHEVQPGETLYRISRQYNVSVDSLRRINGLSENTAIHPGQKLTIKPADN